MDGDLLCAVTGAVAPEEEGLRHPHSQTPAPAWDRDSHFHLLIFNVQFDLHCGDAIPFPSSALGSWK
jgi:hypothetical protein